jgi:glycosyltransferase involved in cell wall biosynthesis
MATPTVSVVITCYDLGRYLDEAVNSVLAQTFQDFEILIVDDGSTDAATRALLAAYRRPRTRVIRSANQGLPAARNLGLKQSTGEFICSLDADDVLEPTCLEKSVEVLRQRPDVAFVSHWLRAFGADEWEWRPERCDFPALLDVNTVNGAALVRRTALEAVGGFDEAMRDGCEDWELWIRLTEAGHRGLILPEFLFRYRRREDSMSSRMQGPLQVQHYRRLVEGHPRSYRRHLSDLIARRERDICQVTKDIVDMEREYGEWLLNRTRRLAEEAWHCREQVSTIRGQHAARSALEARAAEADRHAVALDTAMHEVALLRASKSWTVTAPLRVAYGWLLRLRRRG